MVSGEKTKKEKRQRAVLKVLVLWQIDEVQLNFGTASS